MHLEHVNLTVADLDRSVHFYTQLLGLEERWRGATSDGKPAAHLGSDTWYLALFQARPGSSAPKVDYDVPGLNHVGIVVDDLDASRARLEQLGLRAHHEADYEPGRRLYFFDPDGIEVELVQYAAAGAGAGASGGLG